MKIEITPASITLPSHSGVPPGSLHMDAEQDQLTSEVTKFM